MSLPALWVDRLFDKLTLTYGQSFLRRWADIDLNAVKSDWAHELAGFERHPKAIAWALENLPPSTPPTVLEFRALARKAPEDQVPRLEYSAAGRERVAAELAKLGHVQRRPARIVANKEWAHAVIRRHEAGERVTRTVLKMAKDAISPRSFVSVDA